MKLPHFQKEVRWDVFEENFVAVLLDKLNLNSDMLNKISWKTFLQGILDKCGAKSKENNEVPQPASNPSLLPPYKGLFITCSAFVTFVAEDEFFLALQRSASLEGLGVKLADQFASFKDSGTAAFSGSLYRYCDGSWYRGQRTNHRRDGKGKLQLATGELYEGQFIRGLRHGFGDMRY